MFSSNFFKKRFYFKFGAPWTCFRGAKQDARSACPLLKINPLFEAFTSVTRLALYLYALQNLRSDCFLLRKLFNALITGMFIHNRLPCLYRGSRMNRSSRVEERARDKLNIMVQSVCLCASADSSRDPRLWNAPRRPEFTDTVVLVASSAGYGVIRTAWNPRYLSALKFCRNWEVDFCIVCKKSRFSHNFKLLFDWFLSRVTGYWK